jgi:NAD(P)-dependent dehydrogenase (short-subunit alcohol dehydrogenase family)
MALDYAPAIRVNSLCPGMVERPMQDRGAAYDAAALARRETWAQAQPLARYGTHDEMARAALFLVSDDSAFMTGAALVFDGGMSIR